MGRLYYKYINKLFIISLISSTSGNKDLRKENKTIKQVIYSESCKFLGSVHCKKSKTLHEEWKPLCKKLTRQRILSAFLYYLQQTDLCYSVNSENAKTFKILLF